MKEDVARRNAMERGAGALRARFARIGLSGRVLVLIVCFVLMAEVAIYIPSIANFRNNWLQTRLSAAYTAALVLDAAPQGMAPADLKAAILDSVGARMIVLKRPTSRRMLAVADMPPEVDETIDLRNFSPWTTIPATFRSLLAPPGRILDVRGDAPMGAEYVEVALNEAPLKAAMQTYSINIVLLSLLISLIVASLAVVSLNMMVLRPVRRLTGNVVSFAADPENVGNIITPSGAGHEIGAAEEALAEMERALARELSEKKHLAALGLAVAKINHDLRNMLTSAQLISDRLASASDPLVTRLAPKLVGTLDRAIRFCQATLAYGRATDETPRIASTPLKPLADEALETALLSAKGDIRVANEAPHDFLVEVDREQFFRVLSNLFRNSVEALDSATHPAPAIRIAAERGARGVRIVVADNGPGLPAAARDKLFSAFRGSARPGGTGLGLAIAADILRAHGGSIALGADGGADWPGANFEIILPARTAAADEPRK
ncbi:MAG: HAMP domain-containing histidine kinase [Hyphomicrobiales bacterium]|nr:HAMP domain-containing histidine kinase [Hyphomicrobiales bacterium]